MGFFSAVKKFFGGGTEETKDTQAAAVEKDAVATSVAPEEPAATEPTTPETPPEGSTEPEYDTNKTAYNKSRSGSLERAPASACLG